MLRSIARFTNDSAGIEKSLKLLQSISQISENIGSPVPLEVVQWTIAKNQFALARRYFRLFKWIDCFTVAHAEYQAFGNTQPADKDEKETEKASKPPEDARDTVHLLLSVLKWSFLGIYLFMEMLTITNALSLTSYAWGPTVQLEALRFWFYALAVSVVLADQASEKEPQNTTKAIISSPDVDSRKRRALYKQIMIDGCDLLIPGSIVGWIPLDPVTVGVAGSISAVLGASDVWGRVNP